MNKSEIAELVARKLWLIARGFSPDNGPERLAKTIEIVQMSEIVERAIAESQAPQPEDWREMECPNHPMMRPADCGCELGDGEPSPPPAKIGGINHSPLPWTFTYFTKPDGTDIKTPQDVAETVAHSALKCDGTTLWGVTLDERDEEGRTLVICYTGNGSHSEANAKLIVAAISALNLSPGKSLHCAWHGTDTCGAPIIPDAYSYSGYSHFHRTDPAGQKIDWLHWASPIPHGMGAEETVRIFIPCVVCGKTGPDNENHIKYKKAGGHKFKCRSGAAQEVSPPSPEPAK